MEDDRQAAKRMVRQNVLYTELKELCTNVYFQPPPEHKIVYPCIIFTMDDVMVRRAQNTVHTLYYRYTVKYISTTFDDGDVVEKLLHKPYFTYDRAMRSDNLYTDVLVAYI